MTQGKRLASPGSVLLYLKVDGQGVCVPAKQVLEYPGPVAKEEELAVERNAVQ